MKLAAELREQGRGMAGALLVLGISFAYTVETWRLAVDIPPLHLLGFVVAGLALVVSITHSVGFRSDEDVEADGADTGLRRHGESPLWVEFTEIVFQSLFIGYATLALLGVVDLRTPFSVVVRTGLIQVVPLAVGAALANELLSGEQEELPEAGFPHNLGVFALGAIFFSAPIAPTGEVGLIAAQIDWMRVGVLLAVTISVAFLMLYELEFRGQSRRLQDRSRPRQVGQTCIVTVVGLVVAFGLLVALGGIETEPVATWARRTVVLAFPATVGASGARVILG
jgi:putative integral membrane protein (TIGR02587 family)